jgi:hypothetical protein
MTRTCLSVLLVLAAVLSRPSALDAQIFGPFTMRLGPFCNVITFTAVAQGAFFNLSGVDDRCGDPGLSASGNVFLNPDGTAGGELSIIGGGQAASQVALVIDPGGPSGTWSDNTGRSGTLVFGLSATASASAPLAERRSEHRR